MWPCLNKILQKIWSEKIRTIFTLLLFNILVPIGDQVLDLHLIYKCWNHESQDISKFDPRRAAMILFVPVLLNWFFTFCCWKRLEKEKLKTVFFSLINIYPQFCAARIIMDILKNKNDGHKMKKQLDANIAQFEYCLEAVPSVVILFYLSMIEKKGTGVIVEDNDELKFEIKLYISLITASIGLSKSLKHSVCRIMGNDGHFDGFFTGKYFIIFLACLTGLILKGFCITCAFLSIKGFDSDSTPQELKIMIILWFVTSISIPFLSTISFGLKSWRIIFQQPHLIVLPMFTLFGFKKIKFSSCCSGEQDKRIMISSSFSVLNSVITLAPIIAFFMVDVNPYIEFSMLLFYIISIFLTFGALYFEKIFCCCCACWNSGARHIGVFDVDHPDQEFVFEDGKVKEVTIEPNLKLDVAYSAADILRQVMES